MDHSSRSDGAYGRRKFLGQLAVGTAALGSGGLYLPGAFAEEIVRTPRDAEGPFYPDKLPLDTDNDLLIINDTITPAVGSITHLSGRVLDLKGEPVRGAVVEIWQTDNSGVYLHSKSDGREKLDKNFQGFGRFLTGRKGEYYFRTIKPVAYTGRTPHIHLIVKKGEHRLLTTQLYVKGEKKNAEDFLYKRLPSDEARAAVTIDFARIPDSKIGELAAKADIVVGLTPEDPETPRAANG